MKTATLENRHIPEILQWSHGHPGALSFLHSVIQDVETNIADFIFIRLRDCKTLRGTNLYVLYADLCDHDIGKVFALLEKCPQNILEDACSRQDYTGRELVAKYL